MFSVDTAQSLLQRGKIYKPCDVNWTNLLLGRHIQDKILYTSQRDNRKKFTLAYILYFLVESE